MDSWTLPTTRTTSHSRIKSSLATVPQATTAVSYLSSTRPSGTRPPLSVKTVNSFLPTATPRVNILQFILQDLHLLTSNSLHRLRLSWRLHRRLGGRPPLPSRQQQRLQQPGRLRSHLRLPSFRHPTVGLHVRLQLHRPAHRPRR